MRRTKDNMLPCATLDRQEVRDLPPARVRETPWIIGARIDDRRIATDDVGDQVAGSWSYTEAVPAEARRQNEAWYARDLADPRNTARRGVDIARPRGSDDAVL